MNAYKVGMSVPCLVLACAVAWAAPVPVTNIITAPGFGPEAIETNGQTLVYIQTSAGWYAPTGAVCTACAGGTPAGTEEELPEPSSRTAALTGLKYTQVALNISSGAKFDLGVTVTNDAFGILLGEIGTTVQTAGDPVNVYPTLGGARVGSWVRAIGAADYGRLNEYPWHVKYGTTQQDFQCFLTTFRASDFTNGTGELVFDGIELAGNTGYDPNIVGVIGGLAELYVPEASNVRPVLGMTFAPGFLDNPESNGQDVVTLTTSEGTFRGLTGLVCTAISGIQATGHAVLETAPTNNYAAVSGLRFTTFAVNVGTADWSLGTTLGQSDSKVRFFFGEIAISDLQYAGDPVVIYPLSGGVPVGQWSLTIASNDYGTATSPYWKSTFASYTMKGYTVTFALSDFSGGLPGTLEGVDGFRVNCGVNADPNIFGMYVLPPKGTLIRVQ